MIPYYISGEFAKKVHVSIRTIYYYDQPNLLKSTAYTKGRARHDTNQGFAELQKILLLKYFDISLGDGHEMTIGSRD